MAGLAPIAFIAITIGLTAVAQETERDPDFSDRPVRTGPIKQAKDPSGPRRHFRLKNPALLTGEDAERLYTELKSDMATRYGLSGQPGVVNYQTWKRYNRVPYPSVSHGNRYLSNYGNPAAAAYGRFEQAGRLPVGSILAKDSITVSKNGQAMPGALFLMEKMESGFNYVSGDWRYTMIMPDGSLFGTTNGEGTERVRFCISCHLAVEQQDHLFFIPEEYRQN
ncbi:MAG: hypothetical protein HKP56_08480 [Anderseniella sp.]|nr:hypothetical protein [Anderseniella sp.]